jgi:hypothetical protein
MRKRRQESVSHRCPIPAPGCRVATNRRCASRQRRRCTAALLAGPPATWRFWGFKGVAPGVRRVFDVPGGPSDAGIGERISTGDRPRPGMQRLGGDLEQASARRAMAQPPRARSGRPDPPSALANQDRHSHIHPRRLIFPRLHARPDTILPRAASMANVIHALRRVNDNCQRRRGDGAVDAWKLPVRIDFPRQCRATGNRLAEQGGVRESCGVHEDDLIQSASTGLGRAGHQVGGFSGRYTTKGLPTASTAGRPSATPRDYSDRWPKRSRPRGIKKPNSPGSPLLEYLKSL